MRIVDVATVLALAAGALACQPQTLNRSALTGTVSGADATDTAGGSDGSGDSVAPDSVVPDTAPGDVQADAGETTADGSDNDAHPVDTAAACTKDTDCPAKPCQKGSCSADLGCTYTALGDGSSCDDGDKCTLNDKCQAGSCQPGASDACECHNDDKCLEKSNVCTGPMFCNTAEFPYKCQGVGKGVACPDTDLDDCLVPYCDPTATTADEACKNKPVPDKTPCSDGIACTKKDTCSGGKCVYSTNTCECLDDALCQDKFGGPNDKCTGLWYCDEANTCKKTPATVCPPGDNPCVINACDPASGKCKPSPIKKPGISCDDGNSCTTGDVCEKTDAGVYTGQCQSGTNTCSCAKDADCASKEDGDVCNGTLFCNKVLGKCQLNPASIVTCQTALDTVCEKHVCNMKTGVCETLPTERLKQTCAIDKPNCGVFVELPADASPTPVLCDDGNPCTPSSSCAKGQCVAGPKAYTCSCQEDSDCAAKEDGNLCNGVLYCNKANGTCEINPASVVVCPTVGDTQCAKNICNPKTGACEQIPQASGPAYVACEDGNPCTVFDFCKPDGACQSGPNTCICVSDKDCAAKEDGDQCNGTMFCNKATGACEVNPATVKYCTPQFDNQCRKNTCQPTTGECLMVISGKDVQCDDGNPCTVSDTCADGECSAGPNICECNSQADCGKKEDGNLCNGILYCDTAATPHKCKLNPATVVNCPSAMDTACNINTCDPATGKCEMKPPMQMYALCDDGNPCTAGDVCIGTSCESGANICACTQPLDCAAYDDGNPCNGTMSCIDKICAITPNSAVLCEASDACSRNICTVGTDLKTQCQSEPVPGACDDKNPCTADSCTKGVCSHQAIEDGVTPCSIGALAKVCVKGVCVLKP